MEKTCRCSRNSPKCFTWTDRSRTIFLILHPAASTWEVRLHGRFFSQVAIQGNMSARLSHDSVDGGKTQTTPLAQILRSKERFKCFVRGFFVHAAARVTDGEHHVGAYHSAGIVARPDLVEHDIRRLENELSPPAIASRAFTIRFMTSSLNCSRSTLIWLPTEPRIDSN